MEVSKRLNPYFQASRQGDWSKNLNSLVETKPISELRQIVQEVNENLENLGPVYLNPQKQLTQIYFNRIKQTCRKNLYLV